MARIEKNAVTAIFFRIAFDFLWSSFAFLLTCRALAGGEPWSDYVARKLPYFLIFGILWCFIAGDQHLYVSRRNDSLTGVLFSTARAVVASLFGLFFLSALLMGLSLDRQLLLLFSGMALLSALFFTLVLQPGVWNLRRFGYNLRHIVIVGANERTARLVEVLLAHEHYGYRVEGFLDDDTDRKAVLERLGVHYLGPIKNLDHILVSQVIDGVYITLPVKSSYELIESIAHLCEGVGVPVRLVADLFPLRLSSSDVTSMDGLPTLALRPGDLPQSAIYSRIMNAVVALVCLVALSPVFLITMVVIALTGSFPIFSLQWRQEIRRRPFRQIRFNVYKGGVAEKGYTAIGRFLVRYDLDQWPAYINVLLGQMSMNLPQLAASKPSKKQSTATAMQAKIHRPYAQLGGALLDFLGIIFAYMVASALTAPDPTILQYSLLRNLPTLGIFILFWAGGAYDERLWSLRSGEYLGSYLTAVVRAVCNAAVFSVLITALLMLDNLEQNFLLTFCFTTLLSLLGVRMLGRRILLALRRRGLFIQRVLLIGANERTMRLVKRLPASGQVIAGLIDDDADRSVPFVDMGLKYFGKTEQFDQILLEDRIDKVYITLPLRSHYKVVQELVSKLEPLKCTGYFLADLLPVHIARSQLTLVEDIPLLSLSPICEAYGKLAMKRLVDFLGSSALIAAFSPLFLLLAILIKFDSKGPVLFAQERVGQNQRRFKILKFRSMIQNAEDLRAQLESQNEADGPVFKIRNDPRITRVGTYLRRLSLDELPQLFNVWWGQMSLVGPRPPIPAEVEQYTWNQRRRCSVKPGMTGLWQVSGRSDIPFDQWVQMDLNYIDTWSLSNDIVILLKTFKAVTSGKGAA